MKFSSIPGLDEIKQRLVHSVKEAKVPHAMLFAGRDGALNLPLALAFTTYLHCTNRRGEDSCGSCPACSKSLKYIHPDTHFAFPLGNIRGDREYDEFRADIMKHWRKFLLESPYGNVADWAACYGGEDKQANISVDAARELIKELALKPFESDFKIMIIWQPEFMNAPSANAILKILEEPPARTVFLLISNNPERLLPTIISRTQELTIPMLDDDAMEKLLPKEIDPIKRQSIITEADGNIRLALQLAASEEVSHYKQLTEWLRACYGRNYQAMVTMAGEFHELDRMNQQEFLSYALIMMRETLLAMAGAESLLRSRDGERKFVNDFKGVMTLAALERACQLMNDAGLHLERNGSAKMIFLDLSLQISKAIHG